MPGPVAVAGAHVPGGDGIGGRCRRRPIGAESRCREGRRCGRRGTPAEEARRRGSRRRLRGGRVVGERAPEEGGGGHADGRWPQRRRMEEKMQLHLPGFLRFCAHGGRRQDGEQIHEKRKEREEDDDEGKGEAPALLAQSPFARVQREEPKREWPRVSISFANRLLSLYPSLAPCLVL